jgi:hypothetical protein
MTFKKINAWMHLWLGLASGLVVLILGLTGCALVFEQEIKLLSTPWLHAVAPKGNAEVLLPHILEGKSNPYGIMAKTAQHNLRYTALILQFMLILIPDQL